jgi:hypothetical protein
VARAALAFVTFECVLLRDLVAASADVRPTLMRLTSARGPIQKIVFLFT